MDNKAPRNEPFGLRSTKPSIALLTAFYCELQHMQVADMCAHENTSRLAGFTISLLKMSRISSPFLALQGRQPSTNLSTVLLDRTTTKGWHLHLNSGHTSQSCQSWGTATSHLSHLIFQIQETFHQQGTKTGHLQRGASVISVTVCHLILNGSFLISIL